MTGAARRALAWMPWTGDVRRAEDAAVAWAAARCELEGKPGVLMVDGVPGEGPLAWFGARYQVTSPEAGLRGAVRGPVLAVEPTLTWLPAAVRAARKLSLCVLEGPDSLLSGWAMAAGATDLSTGEQTVDTRSKEQRGLHALLLYAGGRQWADDYGKATSPTQLRHLARTGLPLEVTLGVMLAHGATADGLENIRALALL